MAGILHSESPADCDLIVPRSSLGNMSFWRRLLYTVHRPKQKDAVRYNYFSTHLTTPTAAGGSMASRHRRHGLPSSRMRSRAYTSRTPAARSEPTQQQQTRMFLAQYAVRSIPHASAKKKGGRGKAARLAPGTPCYHPSSPYHVAFTVPSVFPSRPSAS